MTTIRMATDLMDGMGLNMEAKQTLAACKKLHPENTITLTNLIFILRNGTPVERYGVLELSRYLFRLAPIEDGGTAALEKYVTKFCALVLRHYFKDEASSFNDAQKDYEHVVHLLNLNRKNALFDAAAIVSEHDLRKHAKDPLLAYLLSILEQAPIKVHAFYETLFTACRMGVLDSLPKDPDAFRHPLENYKALADIMADAQHAVENSNF